MTERAMSVSSPRLIPDHPVAESIVVGALVFVACMVGIHSRLLFSLGSIWPANAVLLGLLLARPRSNNWITWLMAALGYGLADLSSGSSAIETALLNGSNLLGVAAGLTVARLRGGKTPRLNSPDDVVTIIIIIAAASIAAGLCGAIIGPLLFDMGWNGAFGLWLAVEFVNYAIYVPVVVTASAGSMRLLSRSSTQRLHQIAAVGCLLVLTISMSSIGGPGAPAYVVPGLLWCAIVFRPFANALLAAAVATWTLIAGPLGLLSLQYDLSTPEDATSFRLAVGMIAVGAFAVSAINSAWRTVHADLRHVASHDALTGLLNRGAAMQKLSRQLSQAEGKFSLMMLDIDRFKAINDTYGHPVGDRTLEALAGIIRSSLGSGDFAGRIGGEEFTIVVSSGLDDGGSALAEQLRQETAKLRIAANGEETIGITISIGVAEAMAADDLSLLLSATDSALYAAKHGGRNRVVSAAGPTRKPRRGTGTRSPRPGQDYAKAT